MYLNFKVQQSIVSTPSCVWFYIDNTELSLKNKRLLKCDNDILFTLFSKTP